jgi:hypothetical protein
MASKGGKKYVCDRLDAITGEPCRLQTDRISNLNRHIERKHKENVKAKFIQYVVGREGLQKEALRAEAEVQNIPPIILPKPPTLTNHEYVTSLPGNKPCTAIAIVQSSTTDITSLPLEPLRQQNALYAQTNDALSPETSNVTTHAIATTIANETTASTIENTTGVTRTIRPPIAPWRERRDKIRKRLYEVLEKEAHPVYQVKRSKKLPFQQRAIDWLTQAGKLHFDQYFARLLSQWGVKETHIGTCLLLPGDWAAPDPLRVAQLFNAENCPLAWSDGMVYCILYCAFP